MPDIPIESPQTWYNNEDNSLSATLTDGGTPIDLTGQTLEMQVRWPADSATVLISGSTVDGKITLTDAVNGTFTANFTQADTVGVAAGSYAYDIVVTDGSGSKRRAVFGVFKLEQGVTR